MEGLDVSVDGVFSVGSGHHGQSTGQLIDSVLKGLRTVWVKPFQM